MLYLYDKNTIDFTNNGEPIRHSYDEHVIREEGFYLTFKLLLDKNSDYKKVKKEMIVSAETPDGRNQFRVYDVVKRQDHVEVLAVQLMYDFDNKMVNPFKVTNVSATTVINRFISAFKSSLGPFTLSSSVTETHDFATNDVDDDTPSHNALEVLNRITNRWDSELLLNGYDIRMVKRLGAKTNALLYEKKNISEFEDESSVRGMATRIYATSRFTTEGDDEETVISVTVDSPLINEYAQIYEKSFVNNDARTTQELINWIHLKYSTENIDKPTRNIKVSTNIIDGTEINYGDELVLKYLIHDVDEVIRCVGYDYNPVAQTYYSITLGDWKDTFSTTLTGGIVDTTQRQINQIKKNVTHILMNADGYHRNAYGPEPVPNPINGDVWYYFEWDRPNEIEMRIFEDGFWVPVPFGTKEDIETVMEEVEQAKQDAIDKANQAYEDAKAHADAELERINTALSTDIDGAIELAEQAKQDAIDEAERLVTEQDTIYQEIFEGYDSAVGDLTGSIAEADSKATEALEEAGVSSGLAQSAIDSASRAESTATTANNKAVEAFSKADDATTKADDMLATIETFEPIVTDAQAKAEEAIAKADDATTKADDMLATIETFEPIVTDAQAKAEEAITKTNGIPDTISDIIVDKGLVSGDWVDTRIDDVTGEISYELTNVKGDIPDVIMGFKWNVVSDPTLVRTDYVEDYANLDEYNLKNAEFNLSIDGIKTNITTIEQSKLDTSVYSTFKNNEYAKDVDGIKQRITRVETHKLDDEEFQSFKEHDYEVTVDGLSGKIQVIEEEKLDSTDFDLFKSNEYQLTVDGFNMDLTAVSGSIPNVVLGVEWGKSMSPKMERTDYVEEADLTDYYNPDYIMGVEWDMEENPTLIRTNSVQDVVDLEDYREQTAKFEFTIDGFEQSLTALDNKKLDGEVFSTFKTNDYTNTIDSITQRLSSVETDKLDGNEFQTFKTNDYQVTADGIIGNIQSLESEKLDGNEFSNFKTNEYEVTVDGILRDITNVQESKLDGSTFTTFRNNEYSSTVAGITNRLTSVETEKLESSEYQEFKENDYQVTVDGISGEITDLKRDKLDGQEFQDFKSNEYQLTVDGFDMQLTSVSGAIPNIVLGVEWDKGSDPVFDRTDFMTESPTLSEYTVKTAEYDTSIDGLEVGLNQVQTKKLDGDIFTTFKSNDYDVTIGGLSGRILEIETDKLDTSDFSWFKSNDYEVTVAGFSGDITEIKRDKLDTSDFTNFKSNEYQLTVDGFNMELTNISGSVPDYVFGVEWDGVSNPTLTRTDNAEDSTSKEEFEVFLGDYNFRADGWDATNSYITENSTSINSLINNAQGWSQTISYVDENKTKFNETVSQVDFYKQTIGSDAGNLAQLVMTDEAFVTRIGQLEGMADRTETQVAQLSDSWSMNLKSNGDVVTAINATEDGVRILGRNIILDGDTLVTGNFAVAGNHVILDADTQVRGNFTVTGSNITLDGNTTVTDDFTVTGGSIILDGDTTVHDDFTVTGGNVVLDADTRIQGDFTVSGGNVILDGDTVVRGGFTVLGENVTLDANTTVLGGFKVLGGNVTLDGDTTVLGDFSVFGKNIILDGDTTVRGGFTVSGDMVGSGIRADNITTGELNSTIVNAISLNVSQLVGDTSNFVQSAWNSAAGESVTISASGVVTQVGALSTSLNAGHLNTTNGTKTGRVDANGMQIADSSNGQITRLHSDGLDFDWYSVKRVIEQNSEGLTIRPITGSGNRLNSSLHITTGSGADKVAYVEFTNATSGNGGRIILKGSDMGIRHPTGGVVQIANYANDGRLGNLRAGTFQTSTYDGRGLRIVETQINTLADNQTLFIMPSGTGELRIGTGGSNPTLWPVRASRFVEGSSRASKTNIMPYVGSALNEIKNLQAVTFNRKEDVRNGINYMSLGFIAEDSPSISIQQPDAPLGVDHYKMVTLAIKGIQELVSITNKHKSDILRIDTFIGQHEQEIKELKQKIAELERKIA